MPIKLYIEAGDKVNGEYWVGLQSGLYYGFNFGFKTKKEALNYAKELQKRLKYIEIKE